MNLAPNPCWGIRLVVLLSAALTLVASSVMAQGTQAYTLVVLPAGLGATKSMPTKIAVRGWDPVAVAGVTELTGGGSKASCWIRSQQHVWAEHLLPDVFGAAANSRANAVAHVQGVTGTFVLVAGTADDTMATSKPMTWCNVTNIPDWNHTPLLTLNAGDGEARALFFPDGTPERALIGGWAGEFPPMAVKGSVTSTMKVDVPVIWELTPTGQQIIPLQFGVGLSGYINDIGSIGVDEYIAVGGSNNGATERDPWWNIYENGQSSSSPLPLPLGLDNGEATSFDYEAATRIVRVAGYGETSIGMTTPLLWTVDLDDVIRTWTVEELPLPSGKEGGHNNHVHKIAGLIIYTGEVRDVGGGYVGVWEENVVGGGFGLYTPDDYFVGAAAGAPIAVGGMDAKGRIAVTAEVLPSANATVGLAAAQQPDTVAAVLIPTPATGVDYRAPQLSTLTARPNPFNQVVRIGYAPSRGTRVTVTIYDAAGRVVTSFDEVQASAGIERAIYWDGTTSHGTRAASGVYFVHVDTLDEVATIKVVLKR